MYLLTLCTLSFQPKSTSVALIGKTTCGVEAQESLSHVEEKSDDTEEEWVEQKIDWKKLPRQYMQLSKIRLTGLYSLFSCGTFCNLQCKIIINKNST